MGTQDLLKEEEESIGIYFLKEIWQYFNELRLSGATEKKIEWKYVNGVFDALGLGLEPTIKYLMLSSCSFIEFENWIEKNGNVSSEMIQHFNSIIESENRGEFIIEEKVLSELDLEKWDRDGYIILKSAVSHEDCVKTVNLICEHIGVNLSDSKSWYNHNSLKQGIMIQLFRDPILDKNRLSKRIKLAFEQLWGRSDLLVSSDRVSFNPPETNTYKFPGPNLHWDVSLKRPIPYGLQGLLYLSDTDENQGAFSLVPGFHRKIDTWLDDLEQGIDPRDLEQLNKLEAKPIAGNEGDFIIWNHCLPHGSKPNSSKRPRFVQYINYRPLDLERQSEWI